MPWDWSKGGSVGASKFEKVSNMSKKSNNNEPKQARLVAVQNDEGFHVCTGFIKEIKADGQVVFEDEGQKVLTYGAYEVAIQDLEICLAFAKACREQKLKEQADSQTEAAAA